MKKNAQTVFLAVVLFASVAVVHGVRTYADHRSVSVMTQDGRTSVSQNIRLRDYAEQRYNGRFS